MNDKQMKAFSVLLFVFTVLLGTVLHFTYEWSNENAAVGLFSAVNESTWEHLKLLFFPAFIFVILGYLAKGRKIKGFLFTAFISTALGELTIISLFYTYKGIIGKNYLIADIAVFIIGCAVTSVYFYKTYKKQKINSAAGFILLLTTAVLFGVFTYYPPNIGLFISP